MERDEPGIRTVGRAADGRGAVSWKRTDRNAEAGASAPNGTTARAGAGAPTAGAAMRGNARTGSGFTSAKTTGFAVDGENTGPPGPPISTNGASSAPATNSSSAGASITTAVRVAPAPVIALNTRLIPYP